MRMTLPSNLPAMFVDVWFCLAKTANCVSSQLEVMRWAALHIDSHRHVAADGLSIISKATTKSMILAEEQSTQ